MLKPARMATTLFITALAALPAFAQNTTPPPPPDPTPDASADANPAPPATPAARPTQAPAARRTQAPALTPADNPAPPLDADANQPAQAGQPAGRPANGAVLNSHQIDRYDAIKQLTQALRSDPNNLADWVILGELAQEVATELPAEQADGYYRLARQSYENALKLDPNNQGIQAAADFARQQEANAPQFGQTRRQMTGAYLSARRAELTQPGQPITPTLRVFPPSNVADQVAPAAAANEPVAVPEPNANVAGQPGFNNPYSYPTYQPFHANGQPYTYNQYAQGYFPQGVMNNPQAQPMTFRQYSQQLGNVLRNDVGNALNNGVNAIRGGAVNPAVPNAPPGRP